MKFIHNFFISRIRLACAEVRFSEVPSEQKFSLCSHLGKSQYEIKAFITGVTLYKFNRGGF